MFIRKPFRLAVVGIIGLHGLGFSQMVHITGTVVDSLGSQGIGGAGVKVLELSGMSGTTSSTGAFSLEGPIGILPRLPGHASGSILLRGDRITLAFAIGSTPVSIDAYAGNGTRVFHADRVTDAAGNLELKDMWRAPGRYTVVAKISGHASLFTGLDIGARRDQAVDLRQNGKRAALAKSNAAYTLQVTADGYQTKSLTLGATDTAVGTIRLARGDEQTGVWTNVTPAGMADDASDFGAGSIAGDPLRPSDMYVGGSESGIWKTTDYGKTWKKINGLSPDITRGCIIAVAPTTPATVYVAGFGEIFKSVDAGITFDTLSTGGFDPYSLTIDPYDPNHLLSGLHEAPDVIESTNGGESWHKVGSGSIGGGVSVYPFFIDMGNAAATRTTWFAIAQNGSSPGRTTNGGANWSMPAGLSGLEHPHGNARIFQQGPNMWVGGAYDFRGTIMKSADYGLTWSKVTTDEKPEAVVWGTAKNVYSMYAWACSRCDVPPNFAHAPLPGGTSWTYEATPALKIGPNSVAVAHNGTHSVFVGLMWAEGLWRYVEP
jgi:photosystem II stability/assembly factor-like uncharacterized protein